MDGQLKILSDSFNKCEPIFHKAGLTYELAVRREVRELKGIHYARGVPCRIGQNFISERDGQRFKSNSLLEYPRSFATENTPTSGGSANFHSTDEDHDDRPAIHNYKMNTIESVRFLSVRVG